MASEAMIGIIGSEDLSVPPKEILPDLPSHRFRYSMWHELTQPTVTGDQLKSPRVRLGPSTHDSTFYRLADEGQRPIHHDLRGSERREHRDKTEHWELATAVNLSYQNLGENFHKHDIFRILKRSTAAVHIELMKNHLENLSSITFPSCQVLNLRGNWLRSFHNLPRMPMIQELDLSENLIRDLDELGNVLGRSGILSLDLRRNPVYFFTDNYRYKVFQQLPSLVILDGVIKREGSDTIPTEETYQEPRLGACNLS